MDLALQRGLKYSNHRGWVIVGGDAVDGQSSTFHAFMHEHQLASFIQLVLVPAILHGQSDWPHLPLAGGQPVT